MRILDLCTSRGRLFIPIQIPYSASVIDVRADVVLGTKLSWNDIPCRQQKSTPPLPRSRRPHSVNALIVLEKYSSGRQKQVANNTGTFEEKHLWISWQKLAFVSASSADVFRTVITSLVLLLTRVHLPCLKDRQILFMVSVVDILFISSWHRASNTACCDDIL